MIDRQRQTEDGPEARLVAAFDAVLDADPSDRSTVLERVCGSDAALRQDVERLLRHDAEAPDAFLAPGDAGALLGRVEREAQEADAAEASAGAADGVERDAGRVPDDAGDSEHAPDPDRLRRPSESTGPSPRPAADASETPVIPAAADRDPHAADAVELPDLGPRFTAEALIGRGGMGVVFRARQHDPVERTVAVKLVAAEAAGWEAGARLEDERQTLARLHHPGIASVLDAGVAADGRAFLVMDHVDGERIDAWCDRHRLSVAERVRLAIEVCAAVEHAHQRGIIHRDVKPSNVLVVSDSGRTGGGPRPVLIDFGIARPEDRHADRVDRTAPGRTLGTPESMAPEQLPGSDADDIDTRVDVYGLGTMLYRLLTGVSVLDRGTRTRSGRGRSGDAAERGSGRGSSRGAGRSAGRSSGRESSRGVSRRSGGAASSGSSAADASPSIDPIALHQLVREQPPPRPSARIARLSDADGSTRARERGERSATTLARGLRGDLDWIVMRALEIDRERRYPSAGALADDLRRFLADEPVSAGPPSLAYRARKLARRHRTATVAGGIAVAAMCAATVLSVGFGLSEAAARRDAERAEEQARRAAVRTATARDAASDAAVRARQAKAFLLGALASPTPGETRGANFRVRDLLTSIAEQLDTGALHPEPRFTAGRPTDRGGERASAAAIGTSPMELEIRQTIARTFASLGLAADAARQYERLIEDLAATRPADDPALIEASVALGTQRLETRAWDAAGTAFTSALDRLGDDPGPTEPSTRRLWRGQALEGRIFAEAMADDRRAALTRIDAAWTVLEEAVDGDETRLAAAMIRRARLLLHNRLLLRAERWYTRAIEVLDRPDADPVLRLRAMHDLGGAVWWRMGRVDRAESMLQEAIAIGERTLGLEHPETMRVLDRMATLLNQSARWSEEIDLRRELVDRNRTAQQLDGPAGLAALRTYALQAGLFGEADEALLAYREWLSYLRVAAPDGSRDEAVARAGLAMVHERLGDAVTAIRLADEAADVIAARGDVHVSYHHMLQRTVLLARLDLDGPAAVHDAFVTLAEEAEKHNRRGSPMLLMLQNDVAWCAHLLGDDSSLEVLHSTADSVTRMYRGQGRHAERVAARLARLDAAP